MNDGKGKGSVTECPVCGKQFRRKIKDQIYCGRACAGRMRAKPGKPEEPKGNCVICGKSLQGIKNRKVYCSKACANKGHSEKERNKGPFPTVCQKCGTTFPARIRGLLYCSKECRAQAREEKASATAEEKQAARDGQKEEITVRIVKEIPVFESMRPKIGEVYRCVRRPAYGKGEPTLILQGIGKYGLVVRTGEVRVVGDGK